MQLTRTYVFSQEAIWFASADEADPDRFSLTQQLRIALLGNAFHIGSSVANGSLVKWTCHAL